MVTKVTGAWAEPDEETITKTVENLLKLKVGFVRGVYHAERTTDLSTSSTSAIDALSLTVNAKAGDIAIIMVSGRAWTGESSQTLGYGKIMIDTMDLDWQQILKNDTPQNSVYAMCDTTEITSDGDHTIKFQVATNGNSVTFYNTDYANQYSMNMIVIVVGGVNYEKQSI